jgi:CRISPR-associated endonuclease Csn1
MKNFNDDYYAGFDIGTDSVGYAVADTDYNLCKFKGNAMWGVDLFEESNSAAERRTLRSARRRGLRKRNRIEWLQMLFDEEISKVDNAFFQRLKESCLYLDDKSSNVPYAVFADGNYTDKEFHTDYPTIYHLRKELIKSSQPHDIRLVYLALHHIIKHRGHFLFDNMGSDFESESSFEALFDDLKLYLKEEYEIEFECNDSLRFSEILKDKTLKKTAKSSESYKLFGYSKRNNPYETALIDLMCGRKVKFSDMFGDKLFDSEEVNGITFESGYDDNENTYRDLLQEKFEPIEKAKAVYDWAILADILNGEKYNGKKYISFAKVKTYEEHSSDLKMLKKFVKERCKPLYDEIFRITKDKLDNYTAYCGKYKENGKNGVIIYRPDVDPQDKFCKYLKKKFEKLDKTGYEEMFDKIENGTFMPKIVVKDNGVIPMQVNRSELKAILKNASTYLEFLNNKDENGISVSDKIVKIFEFRIPYYVGPLNNVKCNMVTTCARTWYTNSQS